MDEVAAAVGVTKPLLYNYFGNKEQLFLACMKPAADALLETVVAAVAARPRRRPTRCAPASTRSSRFLDADGEAWRVLYDETLPGGRRDRRAACSSTASAWRALVTAALLDQLPPARRTPRPRRVAALSVALLGAAEALGRWWLRTGAIAPTRPPNCSFATVEPGLRERAARRPTEDATR